MQLQASAQPPLHPLLLGWWQSGSPGSPSILWLLVPVPASGGGTVAVGGQAPLLCMGWGRMPGCVSCVLRDRGSQATHAVYLR